MALVLRPRVTEQNNRRTSRTDRDFGGLLAADDQHRLDDAHRFRVQPKSLNQQKAEDRRARSHSTRALTKSLPVPATFSRSGTPPKRSTPSPPRSPPSATSSPSRRPTTSPSDSAPNDPTSSSTSPKASAAPIAKPTSPRSASSSASPTPAATRSRSRSASTRRGPRTS